MSDLTPSVRLRIERLLGMRNGWVFDFASGRDFSNRTFSDFFADFDIDILSDKYDSNGDSKANRLREFWRIGSNAEVMMVMLEMLKFSQPKDGVSSIDIDNIKHEITTLGGKKYMREEIEGLEKSLNYGVLSQEERRKLQKAISEYKMGKLGDKENAVRDLADVLESLKDTGYKLGSKDDSAIFNIINNFSIRHTNTKQRRGYDKDVWLDWMYIFFLATIGAVVRLHRKISNG